MMRRQFVTVAAATNIRWFSLPRSGCRPLCLNLELHVGADLQVNRLSRTIGLSRTPAKYITINNFFRFFKRDTSTNAYFLSL